MRSILLIAELTVREARRRKIMWAALILGILFMALYWLGFHFIYAEIKREFVSRTTTLSDVVNTLAIIALYAINFLVAVLAVLVSVDTLSGEISSNVIQAVATKPIHRAQILLGKWLGLAAMLSLYALLMMGGVFLSTWVESGYVPPHPIEGSLLIVVEALVLLSLSLLGSTFLSTLANGVMVLGLYAIAFVGGWVEQIGGTLRNETAVNIGIITSLLMPSETLWKRAAYLMQPPLVRDLPMTPFSSASPPSDVMMGYVAAYATATLLAALILFQRRDL